MKTYLLLLATFLALAAFKTPKPVDEMVVKTLHAIYPAAKEAKWFEKDNQYEVSFKQDDIFLKIYFDNNSRIYRSLRYYSENHLSPYIALKIKEKYKKQSIKGIAELTTDEGILYEITLEDSKSIYIVHCNDAGFITTKNKFKKA